MTDVYQKALALHQKYQGKLGVKSLIAVKNRQQLSLAYTPGVAEASRAIAQNKARSFDLTMRGRTIAVISDGSAVLGLGNIGPEAAMPVMEGKSLLMKEFAGVDSVPLVVDTQDSVEIIKFVQQVAPSFAGINLEDISAPRCFEIEEALQDIGIPVFHDDQHGTAIVVTAGLRNAAKVVGKNFAALKVVVVGAGAAGLAIGSMLLPLVADVILVDSKGAIWVGRVGMNDYKQDFAKQSNKQQRFGSLAEVSGGADAIIGVSGPGSISAEVVGQMAENAIVFAMANPTPEIMPEEAKRAGAAVVATGRSDFPNQINNVLAFPGIFRAVIDGRLPTITPQMKQAASEALAKLVKKPNPESIIPDPFDKRVVKSVAQAVLSAQN